MTSNVIRLTEAEAKAAGDALCWKPKHNGPVIYGRACSMPRDHWLHDTPHRFDLDLKLDPMPRRRFWRIAGSGIAAGVVMQLPLQWLVRR